MPKLKRDHRIDVLDFPWTKHATWGPISLMMRDLKNISGLVNGTRSKISEIDRSHDLTPTGRAKAKRDHVNANVAPFIKQALATMDLADQEIAKIRSGMTAAAIDKSDVVGGLCRQELRTWLRSLPIAERTSMLMMPDQLEPEIAAAIIEQPAALSGTTEDQRGRLRDRALAARYPEEMGKIATLDHAIESFDYQLGKSVQELRKLGANDIDLVIYDRVSLTGTPEQRAEGLDAMFPDLAAAGAGEAA